MKGLDELLVLGSSVVVVMSRPTRRGGRNTCGVAVSAQQLRKSPIHQSCLCCLICDLTLAQTSESRQSSVRYGVCPVRLSRLTNRAKSYNSTAHQSRLFPHNVKLCTVELRLCILSTVYNIQVCIYRYR